MTRRGRLVKGVGGFYYVLLDSGETVTCKARGKFRSERIVPTVGDLAEISVQESGYASIEEILPRKNQLVRPSVANIDQIVIVAAACAPKPDWMLVDKLLLQSHVLGVEPLLLLNKIDIGEAEIVSSFQSDYAAFHTLLTSTKTGEGLDALKSALAGRISCFAGQSAVGKSSLLNALFPALMLETGGLAKKTDRGRHTTRRAELWPLLGGAVLDTPGFSLLELEEFSQQALNESWPEFGNAFERCRFAGCRHLSEPDCAVKALLDSGELTRARYERYREISLENEQRRKHRYD
ncbi:MAG TPA: ribosome small subunit-dependent GTPase A [Eubacteriales bacterium]|nr:ribosome small subunit-dependent GTPase A [Eubacteriales bacterium]